ncbi:PIN domain-containing protein [Microbacterium sp. Se5.02b]|uniref:PIN domain-containing protein n=1 Tax=Microbacterium sp. Se5.02b TaxID=2864103 RepID=UPI001C68C36E|nr:PIN domain-containing protein [Microbacterium sp. Se5.02b]QYM64435.1 PIN domain-containing protein [Microbacterium sp. Se5.02b]
MPTSADLLLDTSAALALIHDMNPAHEQVRLRTKDLRLGLAGHAAFETYSVLTRMPGAARVTPARAVEIIERAFPSSVALSSAAALSAVRTLSEAGISGGAVYDGLVGLAAREADIPLVTCDRRAIGTYAALQVDAHVV